MTPFSASRLIPLVDAQLRVHVPYDTFITANRAGRLAITKDEQERLHVDVVDLIHYMVDGAPKKYRWKVKRVAVAQIATRAELQPRTGNSDGVVAKLEEHLRSGGSTEPVWLMRDTNSLVLVDGHQRLEAARRTERNAIAAYIVNLPFDYAVAIARVGNLRHGINLNKREQGVCVQKHVRENPSVAKQLKDGALSQAQLAQQLGVSVATVSRALRATLTAGEKEVVAPGPVFAGLRGLLSQVGNLRLPAEEIAVATVVLRAAAAALHANLTIAQAKEAKAAAASGVGAIAARLPEALRDLLDRRGGDRRRTSAE